MGGGPFVLTAVACLLYPLLVPLHVLDLSPDSFAKPFALPRCLCLECEGKLHRANWFTRPRAPAAPRHNEVPCTLYEAASLHPVMVDRKFVFALRPAFRRPIDLLWLPSNGLLMLALVGLPFCLPCLRGFQGCSSRGVDKLAASPSPVPVSNEGFPRL